LSLAEEDYKVTGCNRIKTLDDPLTEGVS
jgi:hypothetical protein